METKIERNKPRKESGGITQNKNNNNNERQEPLGGRGAVGGVGGDAPPSLLRLGPLRGNEEKLSGKGSGN